MDHKLIFGIFYRPPNSNIVYFDDSVYDILETIAHHPCYVMGNFNLDILKQEIHHPTDKLFDIVYAFLYSSDKSTHQLDKRYLHCNIFANNYRIDSSFLVEF